MKKFVHICEEFEKMWIGKDNGMLPIYMKEINNYKSEIWTNNLKKDLPTEIRGVKIIFIKPLFKSLRNFAPWIKFVKRIPLYSKLIKESKEIDVLMLFHMTKSSYWNAFFYKKFNPKGKVYIKMDFNLEVYKKEVNIIKNKPKNTRVFFKKLRYSSEYKKRRKLAALADHISYETKEAYEYMKKSYAGVETTGKVLHLPNGFDNHLLEELKIKVKTISEKENSIITVGRLGTHAKNTEMLLESLSKIDLKNWKFYFIGPIEEEFKIKIENFYKENPGKKESIIFTGAIYDKKKLYGYYNRAKVFVMTSRWEGFANVYLEAIAFDNYILSTDVGGASDVTDSWKFGKKLTQNNIQVLSKQLETIINNNVNLKTNNQKSKFYWENIIKQLRF